MARPRLKHANRLDALLRARCTTEEEQLVRARAAGSGTTPSEYVRSMTLRGRVVVRENKAPDMALVIELRRIGNNINQQMAIAHAHGEIPVELQRLWAKLELVLDRIIAG